MLETWAFLFKVKILTPNNSFYTNIFRFKLQQIVFGLDKWKNLFGTVHLIAQMNSSSEENGGVNNGTNSIENFHYSMDPTFRETKFL